MILKDTFLELGSRYSNDEGLIAELWTEIEQEHSSKKRYYHTLVHLENILIQLGEVKDEIEHWDTLLFTLFYHDVVYSAVKTDNEAQSAQLAEKRMKQLQVPTETIESCKRQIIATQSHLFSDEHDTNLFTDADLSILGQNWETYLLYAKGVRKEYAIYPDLVYNPGRKKVLHHFLEMERIFKTDSFFQKFEGQAKNNLKKELELL